MGYSVKDRADLVCTFRWLSVRAMETLARWIPVTAEMEAKILFGRQVWEFAQHADALGKRAFELRAPLHQDLAPAPAYRDWFEAIAASEASAERVSRFFDVFCVALARRYRAYLAVTDTLMDEPTVRIVERALTDLERMRREREQLLAPLPALLVADGAEAWLAREAAISDLRAPAPPRNETAAA
jgi:hypothetical protein